VRIFLPYPALSASAASINQRPKIARIVLPEGGDLKRCVYVTKVRARLRGTEPFRRTTLVSFFMLSAAFK